MSEFIGKYIWIYPVLYFACIIGHTTTDDDIFLNAMIILGVPVAVYAMWFLGYHLFKSVLDRPFRNEEWTEASILGKLWYLFILSLFLFYGVCCVWGIYYCVNLLLTRF